MIARGSPPPFSSTRRRTSGSVHSAIATATSIDLATCSQRLVDKAPTLGRLRLVALSPTNALQRVDLRLQEPLFIDEGAKRRRHRLIRVGVIGKPWTAEKVSDCDVERLG